MGTVSNAEDEADLVLLHQYMRPEEELLAYRRLAPWRGEHRWFRSPNVVERPSRRGVGAHLRRLLAAAMVRRSGITPWLTPAGAFWL